MSASSTGRRSRTVFAIAAIVAVVVLLYSVLIAGQLLVGIGVVVPLFVLYLAYRFVRAHERIADALEARTDRTGPDER